MQINALLAHALLCLVTTQLAAAAEAQEPPTIAEARALLRLAMRAADAGEHTRAVGLLERGRSIESNDHIDLALAESLIDVGRWSEAEPVLERLATSTSTHPLLADTARERLFALRAHAAVVELRLAPAPGRAFVAVDGARVGTAEERTVLRLAPGAHVIVIETGDGEALAREAITLGEMERRALLLRPALPAVRLAAPPSPYALDAGRGDTAPEIDDWVFVGLGVGLGAAALIALVVGLAFALSGPSPAEGDLPTVRFGGRR